jgi:hypothetical protein
MRGPELGVVVSCFVHKSYQLAPMKGHLDKILSVS